MRKLIHTNLGAALMNMLLAYVVFMLSRVAFFVENWSTFAPYMSWDLFWLELRGALKFDTSALLYLNSIYLALTLFPLHLKERQGFYRGLRWLYVLTNGAGVAANLIDAVYFQFSGRRTTASVFNEFSNEGNIASIMTTELVNHWYLVLVFVVLVFMLWRGFTRPHVDACGHGWRYYLSQTLSLLLAVGVAVGGIRGSFGHGTHPLSIINANQYVSRPIEAAVVLNTPFTIIRTIDKKPFVTPQYMSDEQLEATYTPVHNHPVTDSLSHKGKNVVVLIVESMGKEYIGSLNTHLDSGNYKGYMPFIDELVSRSLTFQYSYANGRKSIDAMPSVLAGLPMMNEPYFLTSAATNDVRGLAAMLDSMGYSTAFFHGARNLSMGFSGFARVVGYQRYDGLDEYCRSDKHNGMDDWDGWWAIWDEPFLQYMLDEMEQMPQPFLATAFTASSHHPFHIPAQYADSLVEEGGHPMYKCVRYTDMALRRFFERASREPWYRNTIFVLVADHTNHASHNEYLTDLGLYSIPIIIFTPDGTLQPAVRDDMIAQQTDITPTLLHLVGCDKPYLAFGCDLLATAPDQTWAFNYNNGIYQYVKGDLMMQFDGERVTGLYHFKTDPLLQHNLAATPPAGTDDMLLQLKALIQQYMSRMNDNRLLP